MTQSTIPRCVALAATIASILLAPVFARADESSDAFASGNAALRAGRFAEAEGLFEKAFKLRPSPDVAANLAQVEIKLGQNVEAAEHLSYALRLMPASTKPEAVAAMQASMAELRAKLCEFRIQTNVPGSALQVGERQLGATPLTDAVFVEAGQYKVRATAAGYSAAEKNVVVSAGGTMEITLTLQKSADAAEPGRPSWPGWLMGGVGVVAAVTGGALIGVGQAKLGDAEALADEIRAAGGSCEPVQGPSSERCTEGEEAIGSSDTMTNAGIGLGAAGGALVVAGIIWLVVPNEAPTAPPTASAWVTPTSIGLLLNGVF